MKIDVDQQLVAYNGEPMTQTSADDSPAALLKGVLVQACLNAEEANGEQKYKTYQLLKRVEAGGEVELTAEEIAKLKALVGQSYPVAVVGPVFDALEGS